MIRPLLCALAVVCSAAPALAHDPIADMTEAAQRFIASLDEEGKKQAVLEFEGDPRTTFHYVPRRARPGFKIADMNPTQRLLAHRLLASAMSDHGYRKAITVMTLESILHDMENKNPIRDPQLYWVAIFGTPGDKDAWGWRFEGHHLSLSFTIVGGKHVSVTPSFFGSNPGTVKDGPFKGLRTLPEEEDVARALVKSLTKEQRAKAIIATKAPRDIITGQDRKVNKGVFVPAKGIAFSELNEAQQKRLLELVNVYAAKYRPAIIAEIDAREPLTDGKNMHFAWAGGLEPGQGHYYRVQTPAFLFEYDNTQGGANHVHAVWRHFDGDFGADLLREHYDKAHKEQDR